MSNNDFVYLVTCGGGGSFEYACRVNPDNNGYLMSEYGIIFHFVGSPKLKGKTIIVNAYEFDGSCLTIIDWNFKKLVAIKNPKFPTEIPYCIKFMKSILENNKVVVEDVNCWFYDFIKFNGHTKNELNDNIEYNNFIKFITNEVVFFARHENINFDINRRERAWFRELLNEYLINKYFQSMLKIRNNWDAKWSSELNHNTIIINNLLKYLNTPISFKKKCEYKKEIKQLSERNHFLKKEIKASKRVFEYKINQRNIIGGSWRGQLKYAMQDFASVFENSLEFKKYMNKTTFCFM